eukprot:jgi/Psemu1/20902/gm1.20902_g
MLTDPQLGTQLANKIEAEVLTRLATKSQNGSPIGILVTPSKQPKIADQIGQAEKFLSKYTTLVEQMNQETMRVKEDIIKPLQETINSAKKRPPSAKTSLQFYPTPKQKKEEIEIDSDEESKESEEDLNRKPVSKPKSKKDNNFSKYDIPGYRRNEYQKITKHNRKPASKPKSKKDNNFSKDDISAYKMNEYQNFTKHRFHNLEAGVAVRKLCRNSWTYGANFPDTVMSSDDCFRRIPNAVMCIYALYRSMVREPDAIEANEEEQPVQRFSRKEIRDIAETHADLVVADTGLGTFHDKTFKHNPNKNAIAVFLLKGRVKRYHYVLVNAIQSLVLFMYHWDGKYFGRNVLEPALKKQYNDVIRLMEPYIAILERRTVFGAREQDGLPVFIDRLHIYFRFDDHVINNDIIKEINDFNFQLKYYTDGFRCNTEFFPHTRLDPDSLNKRATDSPSKPIGPIVFPIVPVPASRSSQREDYYRGPTPASRSSQREDYYRGPTRLPDTPKRPDAPTRKVSNRKARRAYKESIEQDRCRRVSKPPLPIDEDGWGPASPPPPGYLQLPLLLDIFNAQAIGGLGIFQEDAAGVDRLRVIHGLRRYPGTITQPSANRGRAFGYIDDVEGQEVELVRVDAALLSRAAASRVYLLAHHEANVSQHPAQNYIPAIPEGTAHTEMLQAHKVCFLPFEFIPLVLCRGLTPKQAFQVLQPHIHQQGLGDICKPLLDTLRAVGTQPTTLLGAIRLLEPGPAFRAEANLRAYMKKHALL